MKFENSKDLAVIILFSLVCLLSIVEMVYSYAKDLKLYEKKDTLTNFYLMIAAFLIVISLFIFEPTPKKASLEIQK